jgi:hypothetical protein
MKTKVKIISKVQYESEDLVGKTGYIDGYIRGGDDRPCVVVVVEHRLILMEFYQVEILTT